MTSVECVPMGAGVAGFLSLGLAFAGACSSNNSFPPPIGTQESDGGQIGPFGGFDATVRDAAPKDAHQDAVVIDVGVQSDVVVLNEAGFVECGDAGQVICPGANLCVDPRADPKNCGGCGYQCAVGQTCIAGACACGGGLTQCGTQCVDLSSDESNCGSCGHSCEDVAGSCALSLCKATVIAMSPGGYTVSAIAVDATTVFWTNPPTPTSTTGYVSGKAISGGTTHGIAQSSSIVPAGIAVDLNNVYWTDLAGSVWINPNPNSQSAFGYQWTSPATITPLAVALDKKNVYWVDTTLDTVEQAPKTGGSPIVLAKQAVPPHALAVDPAGTFVYWVNRGSGIGASADGTVNSVATGASGHSVTTLASAQDQPEGIAVDSTNVYWTTGANPGAVKMLPIGAPSGTMPTIVASNLGAPHAIVVDAQYIYWTNYDDNTVMKAPIGGGGSLYTIAKGSECNNPNAIAIDAKNVYWANQGDGTILKVAK